jgi:hypothetical protein
VITLKSVEVSYSVKITAASALGRQIAQHRTNLGTNHFGFQSRNPKSVAIFGIFSPNATYTWNVCLAIFKGHEHILRDKIEKFETRALVTLQSLRSIQCTIYSSLCLYQTYAIDIAIRDVRDRDYNTSKANKPISYNLRHFIIKQYIYRLIRLYDTETFTCYTIDNSKIRNSMYIILLLQRFVALNFPVFM